VAVAAVVMQQCFAKNRRTPPHPRQTADTRMFGKQTLATAQG